MSEGSSLRERKSERIRDAIERAALELALEQGFDHTTVDQIAARADVAPRTVFSRYPTKEAIVFGDEDEGVHRFRVWLQGEEGTLVERLGEFIRGSVGKDHADVELKRLRLQAMLTDPYLRRALRGRLDTAEEMIAQRLAEELKLPADDSGPRVVAAAISGLFLTMAETALRQTGEARDPMLGAQNGLAFLAAGMEALRHPR
jgi:AcrR family transcriptional regulator